jgi:hypothetical protein
MRLAAMCVLILGAVIAPDAEACTCVLSPYNCSDVGTADAVFEATVESIELAPRSLPGNLATGAASATTFSNDSRLVRLRDLKPLRGEFRTTVTTAADSASCGYDFRAGTRYLVVAQRRPDGGLSVDRCGLTRPLSQSSGLQEYIQALDGPSVQTRVWGQIAMPVRWIDFARDFDPIPNSRVSVTGPQRRSMVTGADGRYSFVDLPHGTYTINVDLPGALSPLAKIEPAVLVLESGQAHACAELGFVARIKSLMSGQIADEAGRPLRGVFVQLGLADQLDRSRGTAGGGTVTDANGLYQFDGLPPGRYLVGLNIWGKAPDPNSPFAETYARTVSGETVITLAFGGNVTLAPIVARRLTQIAASGIMREAGGTPARGVEFSAAMLGEAGRVYPAFSVKTDDEGRFDLRLWEGERYRIVVGPRFNPNAELEFVATAKPIEIALRGR